MRTLKNTTVTIIDDYDTFNPTVEEILSNCDSTSNFLLTKMASHCQNNQNIFKIDS